MNRVALLFVVLSSLVTVVAGTQAQDAKVLNVCLVSGSLEYDSDASLARLQGYLEKSYPIKCSRAFRKTDSDIPGLDNLDTCDVMVLFTRRLTIEGEQLARVQKYCKSGKPIVGIRTASHAFQTWLALDKEILGGNYKGHYGAGPITKVASTPAAGKHPILAGVDLTQSAGSLYKNIGHAKDIEILQTGNNGKNVEPVTWTREVNGGRVFYTSLGHQKDFEDEHFVRMVANAIVWTSKRPAP